MTKVGQLFEEEKQEALWKLEEEKIRKLKNKNAMTRAKSSKMNGNYKGWSESDGI